MLAELSVEDCGVVVVVLLRGLCANAIAAIVNSRKTTHVERKVLFIICSFVQARRMMIQRRCLRPDQLPTKPIFTCCLINSAWLSPVDHQRRCSASSSTLPR